MRTRWRPYILIFCAVLVVDLTIFALFLSGILPVRKLQGLSDTYNKVTLQLGDNLFYDVHIPQEAKLVSTNGIDTYEYDLLTVWVQVTEPPKSVICKTLVGDRWVAAESEDGWLNATLAGFETEEPYTSTYDSKDMQWIDTIPMPVIELDATILAQLAQGGSVSFGDREFITTQISYGTFPATTLKGFYRMSTLYNQPLRYGRLTDTEFWITSNLYTVAAYPINYNTSLFISAYGETGKQYAAALMVAQRKGV